MSVGVHSFTFSYTPESMKCDSWASFLTHTFSSPCFGRKPKAKVVTLWWFCFYALSFVFFIHPFWRNMFLRLTRAHTCFNHIYV
jgi:hypothetical protein